MTQDGKKWEHTKKTGGWCLGGLLCVAILPGSVGWLILLGIGLVAATVAGWKPSTEEELADRDPDRSEPVTAQPGSGRAEPGTEPDRPGSASDRPDPAPSPTGSDRTAVGPPSTSPLVGRTDPVDIWSEPVRWGLDPNRLPVSSLLTGNPGLLTGGVSGSGKSVAAHLMLCTVALDPNAQLWLVDGKTIELTHYKELAHAYLGEPDLDRFNALLDRLAAELERRKKAVEGKANRITGRNWRAYDAPFILLHVDEIQLYTLQGKDGQKAAQRLAMIASQCRAFGIFVSVATQRPEDAVVPALLATNLTLKLALRTEDAAQSNTVLGNGMAGRGYRSDRFTPDQQGAALHRGERDHPVALTTSYLHVPDVDAGEDGPDHVRDIVKVARGLRERAGTLPQDQTPPADPSLGIVASALDLMGEREQITRTELAKLLGYEDEHEMRKRLRAAGVCPPHSLHGESVRGWKRADLEAVMY